MPIPRTPFCLSVVALASFGMRLVSIGGSMLTVPMMRMRYLTPVPTALCLSAAAMAISSAVAAAVLSGGRLPSTDVVAWALPGATAGGYFGGRAANRLAHLWGTHFARSLAVAYAVVAAGEAAVRLAAT